MLLYKTHFFPYFWQMEEGISSVLYQLKITLVNKVKKDRKVVFSCHTQYQRVNHWCVAHSNQVHTINCRSTVDIDYSIVTADCLLCGDLLVKSLENVFGLIIMSFYVLQIINSLCWPDVFNLSQTPGCVIFLHTSAVDYLWDLFSSVVKLF